MIEKIPHDFVMNEDNYMKFNLPNTLEDFNRGKGEGVWGIPYTEEDQKLYDSDEVGEFRVILCNDSLYYPFTYGDILKVEQRGGARRAILKKEYLELL